MLPRGLGFGPQQGQLDRGNGRPPPSCVEQPVDLHDVVGEAHQCPLRLHLGEPAEQKLTEATRMFHLTEDGFDDRLAPPVDVGGVSPLWAATVSSIGTSCCLSLAA